MRSSRVLTVRLLAAGVLISGCSPDKELPGQFELTKPRMDREREVGASGPPAVKGEPKESDTVHGGLLRDERVKVRRGDDQPEHR